MKKLRYIFISVLSLLAVACSSVSTTPACEKASNDDKLEILNLVMLFDEHVEEQAKDLVEMSKNNVADVHMISFFIVPEGNPPIDKLSLYIDKYKRLRKAIGDNDCKTGIIFQSIMGHFPPEEMHPYQSIVSRDDSPATKNAIRGIVCPLDENFQKYILGCIKEAIKLKPAVVMVDDDFRLFGWRNACLCPLHLAKLKKDFGYSLTYEQAKKHLKGNSKLDREISDAVQKVCSNSLIDFAKKIRATIDSVDPYLHCEVCGSPHDMYHHRETARVLAGKGKPSTMRIGNARYMNMRYFDMYMTGRKLAVQKALGNPERIYAELDTFPRNRYFAGARVLHAGFVTSMLEGASGAKYWPNRFVDYEPDSGIEFKKILSLNRPAYDTLYQDLKGIDTNVGVADLIVPVYSTLRYDQSIRYDDPYFWTQIHGVMGLPVSYTVLGNIDRPVFVRGRTAMSLTTPQLEEILSKGAVLDGDAALEVQKRGLGNLLGVKVSPWDKKQKITREQFAKNCGKGAGKFIEPPSSPVKLELTSDKTEVFSNFIHIPYTYGDKKLARTLAPASTLFVNEKGGKVAVFASRPEGPNHLSESRKAMYIELLNKISPMPIWYAQDAQCYFKSGTLKNGATLAVLTNVGVDPLETFILGSTKKFTKGEYLDTDGKWKKLDAKFDGTNICVKYRAEILNPVIMRFWQ